MLFNVWGIVITLGGTVAGTCMQCRRSSRTPLHKTVTGRQICDACWDQLNGLAAGEIATGTVAGGIATAGWFARIRARRKA